MFSPLFSSSVHLKPEMSQRGNQEVDNHEIIEQEHPEVTLKEIKK